MTGIRIPHRAPRLLLVAGLLALAPLTSIVADETTLTRASPEALSGITRAELEGHLRFLASDLLEGRDTASRGERLAAEYLAAQLRGMGAEAAGDPEGPSAGYFQSFRVTTSTPRKDKTGLTLMVQSRQASRRIECFPLLDFMCSTRGLITGELRAPVVFAGHGVVSEAHGLDDYSDVQVEGRFVLVLDGLPEGIEPAPGSTVGSWREKRSEAEKRGAAGLLVVHPADREARPYAETMEWARSQFDRSSMSLGGSQPSLPMLYLEDATRDFVLAGIDLRPDESQELPGVRARFRYMADRRVEQARNVVAIFPGTDARRAKEVVLFTAHYDHVGMSTAGEIFNGADDNGSGTVALLEIAEAFSEGPRPPRSVAFLWVSGEEKGLLGSHWFADHVSLPEGHEIVANVNMDMVGRNALGKIKVTPSREHADFSTLGVMCERACKAERYEIEYDADRFYQRSDHYNFARKGIPALFIFSGLHEDYHRPGDTFEKVKGEKLTSVARIGYRLGWAAATAPSLPRRLTEAERQPATTGERREAF